jgi:hypothetical protein
MTLYCRLVTLRLGRRSSRSSERCSRTNCAYHAVEIWLVGQQLCARQVFELVDKDKGGSLTATEVCLDPSRAACWHVLCHLATTFALLSGPASLGRA